MPNVKKIEVDLVLLQNAAVELTDFYFKLCTPIPEADPKRLRAVNNRRLCQFKSVRGLLKRLEKVPGLAYKAPFSDPLAYVPHVAQRTCKPPATR